MPADSDAPDDEAGLPLVVPVEHDPFDVAAARTRAPFAKAIASHPASGLIDLGNYYGRKLMNAITAPGDALYGGMQVTDPETGMPTREAIERGQSVASMAMTGGIPFAQRGAAGMAGGKLTQPGAEASPERIIGASYTAAGKHYVAPNHVLAMDQAVKDLGLTGTSDLVDLHGGFEGHHAANGFMTSTGRVVDRAEADRIASAAEQGQSSRPGSLKSEDMKTDAEAAARTPAITAYHGSPYDFDRFDLSKIGTGEAGFTEGSAAARSAGAYGAGLYFAENEAVAQSYKDVLKGASTDWSNPKQIAGHFLDQAEGDRDSASALLGGFMSRPRPGYDKAALADAHKILQSGGDVTRPSQGKMYHVAIKADPEHFLDWDKPLSEQHSKVAEALTAIEKKNAPATSPSWDLGGQLGRLRDHLAKSNREMDAGMFVKTMEGAYGREGAAKALREAGIPGIKYLDQESRDIADAEKAVKVWQKVANERPNDKDALQALANAKAKAAKGGTSNYVVFDDKLIDILKKYGIAGLAALPAMGAYHFQTKQVDHDPFTPDDGRMRPQRLSGEDILDRGDIFPEVPAGTDIFDAAAKDVPPYVWMRQGVPQPPTSDLESVPPSKNIEYQNEQGDLVSSSELSKLTPQALRDYGKHRLDQMTLDSDITKRVYEALLRTYGRKRFKEIQQEDFHAAIAKAMKDSSSNADR